MRLGALLLAASSLASGCDCRGCSATTVGDAGAAVQDSTIDQADGAPPALDRDASASTGQPAPRQVNPASLAQRFVVGWASGNLDSLEPLCDGEAAELLRRARAGETVDTPLGILAPDSPRARSFSFSDRRAARTSPGTHQISFTLSARLEAGEPIVTSHVVTVRESDGKVISWNAPSPPGGGGV